MVVAGAERKGRGPEEADVGCPPQAGAQRFFDTSRGRPTGRSSRLDAHASPFLHAVSCSGVNCQRPPGGRSQRHGEGVSRKDGERPLAETRRTQRNYFEEERHRRMKSRTSFQLPKLLPKSYPPYLCDFAPLRETTSSTSRRVARKAAKTQMDPKDIRRPWTTSHFPQSFVTHLYAFARDNILGASARNQSRDSGMPIFHPSSVRIQLT